MDRSVDLNWVRFFIKMNQKEQMWDGKGGRQEGRCCDSMGSQDGQGDSTILAAEPRPSLGSCYPLCLPPLSPRSWHWIVPVAHPGHRERMHTSLGPDHPLEKGRPSSQTKIERFFWASTSSSRSPGSIWELTEVTWQFSAGTAAVSSDVTLLFTFKTFFLLPVNTMSFLFWASLIQREAIISLFWLFLVTGPRHPKKKRKTCKKEEILLNA